MNLTRSFLLAVALPFASICAGTPEPVQFDSFSYTGRDPLYDTPLSPGHFRNPIFAGFYPDPDICRAGDDYYLVNSSFACFPGIPVSHSRDLVNWTQVGSVVSRPGQLNYDGLGISRGIFAPALSHHGDTWYLVCTFVDAGGNFVMTAKDPAGPWSDPNWLGFDGIDASLFFDDDGRSWIVNNGEPPGGKALYQGHRAIWLQEFDAKALKAVGPRTIIVNGGSDISRHPVWVEGPHLLKKDGWYYLICAEGGTSEDHSEVVFRSRAILGPFVPNPTNPILTQRNLPSSRRNPVTSTGHADLVEAPNGSWWAVFLGCQPYEGDYYDTGRETFMLPAKWVDGWPVILDSGLAVPLEVSSLAGVNPVRSKDTPLSGNFTWSDDFTKPSLGTPWVMLRSPHETWWKTGEASHLLLEPRTVALSGNGNPSFLGRRLQHAHFDAETTLHVPSTNGVAAGLAIFQNEQHYFRLGVVRISDTRAIIYVEQMTGDDSGYQMPLAGDFGTPMGFRISGDGASLSFFYSRKPGEWIKLGPDRDAKVLSTKVAGGFVGTLVGPFADVEPQ
ncbi:MAG TPA: glycoside hydrolase family 43 protein [Opitutaceae bacterium]|jgi:alpha-N-arabinofuranosidase|nr:glycoside hydrolase family 43 protein [Opitutaceae bacterium]